MLPLRASFNEPWFIDGNLFPVFEGFFSAVWSARRRKQVVHIDNTPSHNSRMTQSVFGHNPLKRLPHPSNSFDISPPDLCLFEKVKSVLAGGEIRDEINFFEAVAEVLNGTSNAELRPVFRSRIEHVERIIDVGGDYLTEEIFSSSLSQRDRFLYGSLNHSRTPYIPNSMSTNKT
jgi:hypothetical protein